MNEQDLPTMNWSNRKPMYFVKAEYEEEKYKVATFAGQALAALRDDEKVAFAFRLGTTDINVFESEMVTFLVDANLKIIDANVEASKKMREKYELLVKAIKEVLHKFQLSFGVVFVGMYGWMANKEGELEMDFIYPDHDGKVRFEDIAEIDPLCLEVSRLGVKVAFSLTLKGFTRDISYQKMHMN